MNLPRPEEDFLRFFPRLEFSYLYLQMQRLYCPADDLDISQLPSFWSNFLRIFVNSILCQENQLRVWCTKIICFCSCSVVTSSRRHTHFVYFFTKTIWKPHHRQRQSRAAGKSIYSSCCCFSFLFVYLYWLGPTAQ